MRRALDALEIVRRRRKWTDVQTLAFLKELARNPSTRGLFRRHELPPPVEGGSPNFTQIQGPGGRVQTLNAPAGGVNTFIWNPQSLKGQLAGGDFLYARRFKFRSIINMTNTSEGSLTTPSTEQVAQAFGQVRVYSSFLGEVVPKTLNSVPLISNHDQYFSNGFRPITRRRATTTVAAAGTFNYEFIFEVAFERDYLLRSVDSCPWLPFFEGGIIEVDLASQGSLANYGWRVNSATQTCTVDWYTDKQALIHSPIQNRLYRVTTSGPEFVLKSVGSPNGLDGVISGSRLAVLSWLAKGETINGASDTIGDNGFYASFGGSGGQAFGTNGLSQIDVPFRDQFSVNDVNAWLEAFLSDTNPIRMFGDQVVEPTNITDITQWPFVDSPSVTQVDSATNAGAPTTSLVCDLLDFWPMIWPVPSDKISDFQKVNGDLSFTATQPNPTGSILNLFRTDEVCGFTPDKVMDLMDRMGLPHKQRGGQYQFVPKYAGSKKADPTTVWGFPLKIIKAT
jgi:hypothetical protein